MFFPIVAPVQHTLDLEWKDLGLNGAHVNFTRGLPLPTSSQHRQNGVTSESALLSSAVLHRSKDMGGVKIPGRCDLAEPSGSMALGWDFLAWNAAQVTC